MNIVKQLHGLLQKQETEIKVILKFKDDTVTGMISGNGTHIPFTIDGPIDQVDEVIIDRYRLYLENRKVKVTDNAEVSEDEKEEAAEQAKKAVSSAVSSAKKKSTAAPAKPAAPKIDPEKEKAIKKAGSSPFIKLFTDVETQYAIAQMEAKDRAIVDKMVTNLQTHKAKPNHDKDMVTYIVDSIHREIVAKLKNEKIADQTKAILNAQESKPKTEEPKPATTAQTTAFPNASEEEAPFDDSEENAEEDESAEEDEPTEDEEPEEEEDVPAAEVLEAEAPAEVFEQPPAPPPVTQAPAPAPAPKPKPKPAPKPAPAPQHAVAPKPVTAPSIAEDLLF